MSTTIVETVPLPALNLTLQNGQSIHYHSDISIDADEIPVIDISRIYSDNIEDRKAVAEQVREAAHRIGFFYITNHGIDPEHAENTFKQAKRFFSQPEKRKMEVCTDLVTEYFGYFPMAKVSMVTLGRVAFSHGALQYNRNGKKEKDLMEAYNWGYNPKFDPEVASEEEPDTDYVRLLWPNELPGFKETLYEHHSQLLTLARRLTRTFALALHLEENYFDDYIRTPAAGMRITHYPPQTVSHTTDYTLYNSTDSLGFAFRSTWYRSAH